MTVDIYILILMCILILILKSTTYEKLKSKIVYKLFRVMEGDSFLFQKGNIILIPHLSCSLEANGESISVGKQVFHIRQ